MHNLVKETSVCPTCPRKETKHARGSMGTARQKLKQTGKSAHADIVTGTVHLEVWDLVAVHLEVNLKPFLTANSKSIVNLKFDLGLVAGAPRGMLTCSPTKDEPDTL